MVIRGSGAWISRAVIATHNECETSAVKPAADSTPVSHVLYSIYFTFSNEKCDDHDMITNEIPF